MFSRSRRSAAPRHVASLPLILVPILTLTALADAPYTRADSDALQQKIDGIVAHAQEQGVTRPRAAGQSAPAATPAPGSRITPVSEREVNAYLRFHLREDVPEGITDPVISILGEGQVAGQAIVDLDAVSRARRSTSVLDPMRWLTGKLPVTATGTLESGDGVARFVFGSATVSGVPVPRSLIQQVLTHYSRTPENPGGLGLEDPFPLPASIREIRVQRGEALVVQ